MSRNDGRRRIEGFVALARDIGWKVDVGGGGHWRFETHDGEAIFVSRTPGTQTMEQESKLRRAGLPIPHKGGYLPKHLRAKGRDVTTTQQPETPWREQQPETDQAKPKPRYRVSPERARLIWEAIATSPVPLTSTEIANELRLSRGALDTSIRAMMETPDPAHPVFRRASEDDERPPGATSRQWLFWPEEPVPHRPYRAPEGATGARSPEPATVAPDEAPTVAPEAPQPASVPVPAHSAEPPAPTHNGMPSAFTVEAVILRDNAGELWHATRMAQSP